VVQIGGKRRLKTMTKKQRSKVAAKAARTRWQKAKKQTETDSDSGFAVVVAVNAVQGWALAEAVATSAETGRVGLITFSISECRPYVCHAHLSQPREQHRRSDRPPRLAHQPQPHQAEVLVRQPYSSSETLAEV
jgi:hypothetical protein